MGTGDTKDRDSFSVLEPLPQSLRVGLHVFLPGLQTITTSAFLLVVKLSFGLIELLKNLQKLNAIAAKVRASVVCK